MPSADAPVDKADNLLDLFLTLAEAHHPRIAQASVAYQRRYLKLHKWLGDNGGLAGANDIIKGLSGLLFPFQLFLLAQDCRHRYQDYLPRDFVDFILEGVDTRITPSADSARMMLNQYIAQLGALPRYDFDQSGKLQLKVGSHPFVVEVVENMVDWLNNPTVRNSCDYCGALIDPASDRGRYCTNSCRTWYGNDLRLGKAKEDAISQGVPAEWLSELRKPEGVQAVLDQYLADGTRLVDPEVEKVKRARREVQAMIAKARAESGIDK